MKKLFTTLVISLMVISLTPAMAQDHAITQTYKTATGFLTAASASATANPRSHSISVSKRASKQFAKRFTGITDAAWVTDENGYVVRFTEAGIQNWGFFSKTGKWKSRMRYYTKTELPAAVRNQVEETYPDYNIASVKEVQQHKTMAYLVSIEDATTWKVIRVVDGETDVWEAHEKE